MSHIQTQWENYLQEAQDLDAKFHGRERIIKQSGDLTPVAKQAHLDKLERERQSEVASLQKQVEYLKSHWQGDIAEDTAEAKANVRKHRRQLLRELPEAEVILLKDAIMSADVDEIKSMWEDADDSEKIILRQYGLKRLENNQPSAGQISRSYTEVYIALSQPFDWEDEAQGVLSDKALVDSMDLTQLDVKSYTQALAGRTGMDAQYMRSEPADVGDPYISMIADGKSMVHWDGEPATIVE